MLDGDQRVSTRRQPAPAHGLWSWDEAGLLDLRGIAETLWRSKWLVLGVFLTIFAVACVVVARLPSKYTATAQIILEPDRSLDFPGAAETVRWPQNEASRIEGEIEILTTEQLMGPVVDRLDLMENPEFNPSLRTPSLIGRLSAVIGSIFGADERDVELVAEAQRLIVQRAVLEALHVKQVGLSPVIEIAATSEAPRMAARIANALADAYLVAQLQSKFDAARRTSTWLSERIEELRRQADEASAAIDAFKHAQAEEFGQSTELTTQQMAAVNEQLATVRAEADEAKGRLTQLLQELEEREAAEVPALFDSPIMQSLREQRWTVASELAELSTRYSDEHPRVIERRAQFAEINRAIAHEAQVVVSELANRANLLRAQEAILDARLDDLESQVLAQSRSAAELRQLEADAATAQQVYEAFLNFFKERYEGAGRLEPDARLISEARPPIGPSEPNRPALLAIAGVVGLACGMALALGRERFVTTYRTPDELEAATGLPVLASVPAVRKCPASIQALLLHGGTALSESMRSLRTTLFPSGSGPAPRVVMVTSALASEGKSTLSLLLAKAMRDVDRSTVVVDCDVRRPSLIRALEVTEGPDLISVLEGRASVADALRQNRPAGFSILPIRVPTPDVADLLASDRFAGLVAELRQSFDLVVLDAPPVLALSDATIIGRWCDTTVCVVRWRRTPGSAVTYAIEQLRRSDIRLAGTVLSRVDPRAATTFSRSLYRFSYSAQYNPYYRLD